MKDYSILNNDVNYKFILSYKVIDVNPEIKKIQIKFANGRKSYIKYTEENENKILEKMEKQVNESDKLYRELKNDKIPFSKFYFIIFSMATLLFAVNAFEENLLYLLYYVCPVSSVLAIGTGIKYKKYKSIMHDIEKNKKFLHNIDLFKDTKVNENIIPMTNSNAHEMLLSKMVSKEDVNINDIDKMKKNELDTLIQNIKIEKELDFNYEKPKKLVLKK